MSHGPGQKSLRDLALLALGALGVVYGDIGTGPLYALKTALQHGGTEAVPQSEVIGIISLLIWALLITVTAKYVLFLMRADNKGEGGTLSLMALAQHALGRRGGAVFLLGVLGAALFVAVNDQLQDALPRLLGGLGGFETVVFGALLVLILQVAPEGLWPHVRAFWRALRRRVAPTRAVRAPGVDAAPLPARAMPAPGTPLLSGSAGIVDTGTTLLLLATDAFQAYQDATGATPDESTGLLSLTEGQFANLQSLFFTIGGTTFELTPNAQIWPRALNSTIGGEEGRIYLVAADLGSESGQGLDFISMSLWFARARRADR